MSNSTEPLDIKREKLGRPCITMCGLVDKDKVWGFLGIKITFCCLYGG
jgi:hypothetical protein